MALKNESGYIALTSTIIISILLLTITFSLGFAGFFTRFNGLNNEYRKMARYLAEGCVDIGLLYLTNDWFLKIVEPKQIYLDGHFCHLEITVEENNKIIKTHANYQKANIQFEVEVAKLEDKVEVVSWREN